MLERLGSLSAARPRRSLTILLAFIVLAGVGGAVAGQLEAGGGFTTESSESSRADDQLQRATGETASPGIVLLVSGSRSSLEHRAKGAAHELAGLPGVSAAT